MSFYVFLLPLETNNIRPHEILLITLNDKYMKKQITTAVHGAAIITSVFVYSAVITDNELSKEYCPDASLGRCEADVPEGQSGHPLRSTQTNNITNVSSVSSSAVSTNMFHT